MVVKIDRAVIFTKSHLLALPIFTVLYFFSSHINFLGHASFLYYRPFSLGRSNLNFFFGVDRISFLFRFILRSVVCLVTLYAELYMSHYNNKKFSFLIISFILAMVILSSRESFMSLLLGWDGLGVTSICLIMFYPNKTTLYNSVMTIFFNRLGDVALMCSLSRLLLFSFSYNILFVESFSLLPVVFLCSFTKSAQFPLSSWLPAAISAPTPISAIVHSSTLVTAGVFLVCKYNLIYRRINLLTYLSLVSLLTFFLGGLMGILELDFKKVVAFSTIRQIRMVIVFCSFRMVSLGLSHMFLHALFKTLLFCCSGLLFLRVFREQASFKISSVSGRKSLRAFLLFSVFRITGLLFSSSFFSKDIFIEEFFHSNSWIFFYFLACSCATILYSAKILDSVTAGFRVMPSKSRKFYSFKFIVLFSFITLFRGSYVAKVGFLEQFSLISTAGLWIILLVLGVPLVVEFKPKKLSVGYMLFVKEIALIKFVTYSAFKSVVNSDPITAVSFGDNFIFKPRQFKFKFPTPEHLNNASLYFLIAARVFSWHYRYSVSLIWT